jgi:crossover junction endodeoxyribonuclease RuvC
MSLVVASFDPSIGSAGVSAVRRAARGYDLLEARTVRTSADDPLEQRARVLWDALAALVRRHHATVLVIEQQAGAQVGAWEREEFNADNSKTVTTVGLALGVAFAYGARPLLLSPQQAKIAVLGRGNAHADKHRVREMVRRITGARKITLDASDAVALAIAGAQRAAQAELFGAVG